MEFDPAKDATNIAKHGISLARARDLELLAYVDDPRYAEPRFRLYGLIDGTVYCVAGTDAPASFASSACGALMPRRYGVMSDEVAVVFDDDNPEWTEEDFARALRGDAIPAHIRAAFPKMRGRPPGGTKPGAKVQVALRLDPDVLAAFKDGGPGWQTRMNAALRAAMPGKRSSAV